MSNKVVDVISYEGSNEVFIYQSPIKDFNSGSQLIVHESQEAIFFMNGQALDSFGPGRYTLETQNLPFVSKFFNRLTGDTTPFHCELYFVNKTEQMAIKWGTDSKMEFMEPTYQFPIQLGACGEMNLSVEDGRKLLIKVIGTERELTHTQFVQKMRAFLMTKVKPYMVKLIRERGISVFQIDEQLQVMSDELHRILMPDFSEYGVSLDHFFLTNVIKPEDDKNYRHFKDLYFRQYAEIAEAKLRQQVGVIDQQTAAQRMVIEAQGIAQKRSIEGYTYQDERGFDVAERVASNEAMGQFTNMGVGMGMISGIGSTVGNQVGGIMQNALSGESSADTGAAAVPGIVCGKCGAALPSGAKFCLECGEKVAAAEKKICPVCGKEVPAGAKFCLECGATLTAVCSSCGKELPAGAKFCLECGTPCK